ncbi:hypothetical protein [Nocardioides sp. SR21]|uniref:hypothetical protein n=1 Tax=Nocardioides sp. SR21 TaxID=2919501 RepID=UPI001FA94A28|nr:hypothetical protein [Nocardioides sp. SR21]
MGSLLYPRLPRAIAQSLILARTNALLSDLAAESVLSHPDAEPSATGGHPVDADRLGEVRLAIRHIAEEAGYPRPLGTSTQSFDRPCGSSLFRLMDIVPADAAEEGVWSFLTLVVVPEIGPWRFPGRSEERLLGRPRNVLRRTWWRAWALGPDLERAPDGCTPLGEDESVQIMERPSLGGNRRTARALQAALWRAEQTGLPAARSEVMRELARRLRAVKSHISLDALDDDALSDLLDRLTGEALKSLSA